MERKRRAVLLVRAVCRLEQGLVRMAHLIRGTSCRHRAAPRRVERPRRVPLQETVQDKAAHLPRDFQQAAHPRRVERRKMAFRRRVGHQLKVAFLLKGAHSPITRPPVVAFHKVAFPRAAVKIREHQPKAAGQLRVAFPFKATLHLEARQGKGDKVAHLKVAL